MLFRIAHLFYFSFFIFLFSCSVQKQISSLAKENVFSNASLQTAHIGISVYDPAKNQFLYNYQGEKYFVPASNTKLFSLYAGMKHLGDSLTGIRYMETDTAVFVLPAGDPTLLHSDFKKQPVIDFLRKTKKNIYFVEANWQDQALGAGWSWDDYNDDYMVERSALPVYGNIIKWVQEKQKQQQQDTSFDPSPVVYSVPEVNWKVRFTTGNGQKYFFVRRRKDENIFDITQGNEVYKAQEVPFITNGLASAVELLKDTVGKEVFSTKQIPELQLPRYKIKSSHIGMDLQAEPADPDEMHIVHSQPVDSLYIPMMYRSDNFFAEQTLLMVSNEKLGIMNDEKIIDTLLKTDLKELPQKPNWADGSGLSRFNLFTPNDFVWLLDKMKNEFGMDRMKRILPTGGKGTLRNYYKDESNYIFAKTGSLTGVICLSGYLYTIKGRLLIFSVLVNNHNTNATEIRKSVEQFLTAVRKKY